MIIKEQAIKIAEDYVLNRPKPSKIILVLQLEKTIEFELGWVFFYQSKKYIETGNLGDSLVGNSPFIVDKRSGEIHVTGTAYPTKKYIQDYLVKNSK